MTKDQFFSGIVKILVNAADLIEDADLLKKNNRLARAYTLYQLSIEEIGKAELTFSFALFEDFDDPKINDKYFKFFRDHKKKTTISHNGIIRAVLLYSLHNDKTGVVRKALFDYISWEKDNVDLLNDRKNWSLYTNYTKKIGFTTPSESIDENHVTQISDWAKLKYKATGEYLNWAMNEFDILRNRVLSLDLDKFLEQAKDEFGDLP